MTPGDRTGPPAAADPARARFDRHAAALRDPAEVIAGWSGAGQIDPALLKGRARGDWWDLLRHLGITLLISREYEHFLIALSAGPGGPRVSYLALPHPSGIVADRATGTVFVAATRNPNQIVTLSPAGRAFPRSDLDASASIADRPLVPVSSAFLPGCLYLHDLALIDGSLHGNAAGHNAVIRIGPAGSFDRVWWPRAIETEAGPDFGRNYLQLNSIAAGPSLAESFFSASTDRIGRRRPGHRDFPVDRRGVVFSGTTREPIARGLTRPHSARLDPAGRIWIANSGYGEVGVVAPGAPFEAVARLPGWTRGLLLHEGGVAFAGTSRILPRFERYAPGLSAGDAVCGVHAIEMASGRSIGSIVWPEGNQIFAIDWLPRALTRGFPFDTRSRRASHRQISALFYSFVADATLNEGTPR